MLEVLQFLIDNLAYIVIVSIIFLSLLVIFPMLNGNLNGNLSDIKDKPIEKIVTIESMI